VASGLHDGQKGVYLSQYANDFDTLQVNKSDHRTRHQVEMVLNLCHKKNYSASFSGTCQRGNAPKLDFGAFGPADCSFKGPL